MLIDVGAKNAIYARQMKISISKKLTKNTAMAFMLCAMLLGSFVYILSPSFAVGTVLALLVGPIYLMSFLKLRQDSTVVFLFILIGALLVFSIVALLIHPSYENLQYLKAFGFSFLSIPIVTMALSRRPSSVELAVVLFLAIVVVVAVAQLAYIYFGIGMNPARMDAEQYVLDDLVRFSGPRSIFGNPNDFGAICAMVLIYILYKSSMSDAIKGIGIIVLSLMIFLSASRISIFSLLLILIFYYFRGGLKWKKIALSVFVFGAIFLSLNLLYRGSGSDESYWLSRTSSLVELIASYAGFGAGKMSDGSVDIRLSTYVDFLSNFWSIGVGSFKAKDYSYFLSDVLMRQDPHSLMVELGLLYGYFGFIIYVLIIFWVYLSMRQGHGNFIALVLAFVVAMLTFTSSSVINFPGFWVMLLMCFIVPSVIDVGDVASRKRRVARFA